MDNPKVAICKDVLAQLDAKTFTPTSAYCTMEHAPPDADLQTALPRVGHCEACALGAMFLSHVRLFDEVPSSVVMTTGEHHCVARVSLTDALHAHFTDCECNAIEAAFEAPPSGRMGAAWGRRAFVDAVKALPRNATVIDVRACVLRALMENIIYYDGDVLKALSEI